MKSYRGLYLCCCLVVCIYVFCYHWIIHITTVSLTYTISGSFTYIHTCNQCTYWLNVLYPLVNFFYDILLLCMTEFHGWCHYQCMNAVGLVKVRGIRSILWVWSIARPNAPILAPTMKTFFYIYTHFFIKFLM